MRSFLTIFTYVVSVFLFSLCAGFSRTAQAQVADQDRAALIALYLATTNEPWFHEYGFSQAVDNDPDNDVPVEDWQTSDPIEVANGRVVYVNLYANNLTGTLPAAICDMDALRELDLGANHLSGPIPECIGNMTALTKLDIAGQEMTGSLPESLAALENLEILDLRFNELTGSIPGSLGNSLTQLIELHLQNNQLTGSIPASLGSLAALQVLNLGSNQLTGSIPPVLGELTALQTLDLRNNQLAGSIPATLGGLASLIELDLASNQLAGSFPAALGGLSSLQYLYLHANGLTDFEPGSYAGWTSLQAFYVDGNEFSDLPDLSNAGGLADIGVASNHLTFADLEPLAALSPSGFFFYWPQRTVLDVRRTIENQAVVLSVEEDGTATMYQWERWDPDAQQWNPVPGATEPSFTVEERGSYRCSLTNTLLPNLTLTSGGATIEGPTIVVNSVGDAEDADTGDDVCDTGDIIERDGQDEPECTLRAAIQTANNPGNEVPPLVAFDIPGESVPVILPGSELPAITQPVTIDGTTHPSGAVVIQGTLAGLAMGLRLRGDGSVLKGLRIREFLSGILIPGGDNVVTDCEITNNQSAGIYIEGDDNVVEACIIMDNQGSGIRLGGDAEGNTITGSVISGNTAWGVDFSIRTTFVGLVLRTLVSNNKIGTDAAGQRARGNGRGGIAGASGDSHKILDNVISGNPGPGISFRFVGSTLIEGNRIGVTEDGTSRLPNGVAGIVIDYGNVTIKRNVISGNEGPGVIVLDGYRETEIEGNKIGTDISGQMPLGNEGEGIRARNANVSIRANVIAANLNSGIRFSDSRVREDACTIEGNWIGTDPFGRVLGNGVHGVSLERFNCEVGPSNVIAYHQESGVYLLNVEEGSVKRNTIATNRTGLALFGGTASSITNNVFRENDRHTDGVETEELKIQGNTFIGGQGVNTGIHLTASSATIEGNLITDDAGDAITLEDGSTATVTNNNIFGNAGIGLNNLTPLVMVSAPGNWWGDASGPGGEGPGTGDEVSAGVDVSGWLDAMVAVVASAERDEILLPVGEPDTVSVFVQNWQVRDDVLDLTISDPEGWLQSPAALTVTLDDSTGAEVRLAVAVPAGTPGGTTSTVEVTATSQADNSHSATTTFTLRAESAALAEVLVLPATVEVAPGDTVQFDAVGLDQFSRTVAITPTWSATGGEIDGNGVYIAGGTTGAFVVTATDPATGLSGTARVGNGVVVAVEEGAEVPGAFHLAQNYPNPFNPETTIAYTLPQPTHVRLSVYDVLGREVAVLVNEVLPAGTHQARFEAGRLASGVYVYGLRAGRFNQMRTMILLK